MNQNLKWHCFSSINNELSHGLLSPETDSRTVFSNKTQFHTLDSEISVQLEVSGGESAQPEVKA